MKSHIRAMLPITILLLAAPLPAMQRTNEIRPARTTEAAPGDADGVCQPRDRRSRGGLGRALRSARNSGLIGAVAGRTGGGYLAGSIAETAIDIGAAEADRAAPRAPDPSRDRAGENGRC